MPCTSSEGRWSSAICGDREEKCGRPIPNASRIASRSQDCSGISSIWFGSSSSRFFTSFKPMADSHSHHDIKKHVRTYILVFVALLIGTVVTVGMYYVHF